MPISAPLPLLAAFAVAAVAPTTTAPPSPAPGAMLWDAVGHQVVARIAWDHMTPLTRSRVVALLRATPEDADVCDLPPAGTVSSARMRNCFVQSSTWADRIRPLPQYHRPTWHFVNTAWRDGPVEVAVTRNPDNAVARLEQMKDSVADIQLDESLRGIQLAWIIHLVGDIHQPLHTSSRVTSNNPPPDGDRGGNGFRLAGIPDNLHSWWDGSLRRHYPQRRTEAQTAYITRISRTLQEATPDSTPPEPFAFEGWLQEGMRTVRAQVYAGLEPNERPDAAYRDLTNAIAEPAAARGGYRLALLLNELFDPTVEPDADGG